MKNRVGFGILQKIFNPKGVLLILVLGCGLAIRIWNFPALHEVRDGDELGYLSGGLLLWEGMAPGFKMSPAGPLTWLGWAYGAGLSARNFFIPGENERPAPRMLRPFVAVERALFDAYRDMAPLRRGVVLVIVIVSIWGIWASFQTGHFQAKLPGAFLAGGLMAILPQFVAFSGMARPYMMAWSFAVMAYYYSATQVGRRRFIGAAIFMGLSISSRVDMLAFVPIVIWQFWHHQEPTNLTHPIRKFCGITVVTVLLASPWLLTHLMGNLRTTATVRIFGPGFADTWVDTLRAFAWDEGLGPVVLLLFAGLTWSTGPKRWRVWLLGSFIILLIMSMFKPTGYGLHHQGAALVAVVTCIPLALHFIQRVRPRAALALAILGLLPPTMQTIAGIAAAKTSAVTDQATAWVEQHVPSGTTIYLHPTFRDPLPTAESADALWSEVSDEAAWRKKFEQGLHRFDLSTKTIPRALSEENLIQERGNRRRWFLLGARNGIQDPRFNIKLFSGGSPFDIPPDKVVNEYRRTGGVLIWRGSPVQGLKNPTASWVNGQGRGTFVYCSFEVKGGSLLGETH